MEQHARARVCAQIPLSPPPNSRLARLPSRGPAWLAHVRLLSCDACTWTCPPTLWQDDWTFRRRAERGQRSAQGARNTSSRSTHMASRRRGMGAFRVLKCVRNGARFAAGTACRPGSISSVSHVGVIAGAMSRCAGRMTQDASALEWRCIWGCLTCLPPKLCVSSGAVGVPRWHAIFNGIVLARTVEEGFRPCVHGIMNRVS